MNCIRLHDGFYAYADVAFGVLNRREMSSFLYLKDHGISTLWEKWEGKISTIILC